MLFFLPRFFLHDPHSLMDTLLIMTVSHSHIQLLLTKARTSEQKTRQWARVHENERESAHRSVVSDSLWPHRAHQVPLSWNFPGKNTGVDCHSLLQGIFPIKGLNLGLQHCKRILYRLSICYQGKHMLLVGMTNEQCAYCTTVSFLVLMLYYSWIKYNLREKLGVGYTALCSIFANFCEYI